MPLYEAEACPGLGRDLPASILGHELVHSEGEIAARHAAGVGLPRGRAHLPQEPLAGGGERGQPTAVGAESPITSTSGVAGEPVPSSRRDATFHSRTTPSVPLVATVRLSGLKDV